ncbi:ubiquitin thioesterase trabid-like isoform X2 [Ostrinia furnacalis]|uniref:ubiquitin thioesterase trabid-like isoform X2 n=1 Tax=Ostrinia furnacalis TaxID=93504 RepID=UPI00103EF0F7|nr:ubiquitin thioesterase trabid-like isoform X2 [Ostrinia furnacalis]
MSEEAQNASPTPAPEAAPAAHADASTNVSQAQVAQMTASSAPPGENGKWSCEVCTYENFPLSRKCTMCRAPKTCLNENIFKLQDDASALPTQDVCGAEAVAERLKPLRISSPQGPAAACSVVKWPCPTCTYENWPKALKCAMCGAAGPPAPAPAPAAAPAPPNNKHIGINDICNSQAAPEAEGRRSKRRNNNIDWIWLQACLGVVEGDPRCVDAYLASGGDPARALTPHEVALLNRASAFDAGHTLVHLAIRFQRQDILSTLLSRISGGGPGLKRSPSYIAPDLAAAIRRHMAGCVRHKKGSFPCRYINELSTFALPAEIEELPAAIQEQLFSELLDRDAQQTLEAEPPLINWSHELSVTLGSRLYALWNRSAGDCLPDAVCQAAYGVFDRHNALRAALADSLHHAHRSFYSRWQGWERVQAALLQYAPDEAQLRAEWARLVAAAARPGTPLHQVRIVTRAVGHRRQGWERVQAALLQYAPDEAQLRAEWARLVAAAARPGTPLHQVRIVTRAVGHRRQGWERVQAALLQYAPDEAQLRAEWARLVAAAARPGTPLHQVRIVTRAVGHRRQGWERVQAALLQYAPDEAQLRAEWARLVAAAARPGTPLHQVRIVTRAVGHRRQGWERVQAALLQYAPDEAQLRAEWARLVAAAARPGTPLHQVRIVTRAVGHRRQGWERVQAALLQYAPDEAQLRAEWARLVAAAARPGTPLHQLHVFVLAHIMRRPIIVYGVNVVNSFRGEALGFARFQGIYLPLLWEPEFCSRSPLCLGYTRGHFSALVPLEPYSQRHTYICREQQEENEEMTFLPLTDSEGKLLPVHFLTCDEMADEEGVVRRWLSACVTSGGVLAARQQLHARPLLQAQLLEEWLNHYRRLAQQTRGPFPPRLPNEYSSDPDTDDE